MPAPYEMPDAPIAFGLAGVCARAQSITALTSSTVSGPAISICPAESQNPREV